MQTSSSPFHGPLRPESLFSAQRVHLEAQAMPAMTHEQLAAIPKKQARAVEVREASFDDYPQIALLQARYGMDARSYAEWSHFWVDNPAYRGREWWPIGWVLENQQHEIVGYLGNIPLIYQLQGKSLLAATGRSLVVDVPYRTHSFLLLNQYFRQSRVDLLLNTTVNAQAVAAYRAFRAQQVPVGEWDRPAFRILNYGGFASSLLRSKSVPGASILGLPVGAALALRDLLLRKNRGVQCGTPVEACTRFDQRFDTFWEALKKQTSKLLGNRDRKTLNWHFKYALRSGRAWVFAAGGKQQITAYAVFQRDDNRRFGLKRIRLVDFQSIGDDYSLLLPMFATAFKRCQRERIHMLEVMGHCAQKREIVDALLPHTRHLGFWMYFYKANDRELAKTLSQPELWDPTGFDGDSSL